MSRIESKEGLEDIKREKQRIEGKRTKGNEL